MAGHLVENVKKAKLSTRDLWLWVASDEEKTEVGIAVHSLLTNLDHLGKFDKSNFFIQ